MDGAHEIAFLDLRDELRDLDIDGAAVDARRLLAAEAALRFHHCVLFCISEGNFAEVLHPHLRRLFRHLHAFAGFFHRFFLGIDLAFVVPQGASFFPVVHLLAEDKLREIYQVGVKFRAVDADEFCLAADCGAAAAAHTGAVNHDSVEADDCLDSERTRYFRYGLHHDDRADADNEGDIFFSALFDYLLQYLGNETVGPV